MEFVDFDVSALGLVFEELLSEFPNLEIRL